MLSVQIIGNMIISSTCIQISNTYSKFSFWSNKLSVQSLEYDLQVLYSVMPKAHAPEIRALCSYV
jgi:hypothetical protein